MKSFHAALADGRDDIVRVAILITYCMQVQSILV